MNLLVVLMGVAAGIAFDAAFTHVLVALSRRPRDWTRLTFAVTATAAGVGAIAVLAMYSGDSPATHAAVVKWLFLPSNVVFTVAAAWLIALFADVRPRLWLLGLTAGGAIVLVINALLPYGLLHRSLGDLREVWFAGQHVMAMTASDPHPLYVLNDVLSLTAFVFMYYALAKVLRRGVRGKAAYLALAVVLFSVTTLLDALTDHGIVSTLYLTQLCFVGVVLTMSIALRRESLHAEKELQAYRTQLESLVEARVRELDETNLELAEQVVERLAAEEALRERVKELGALQHFTQTLAHRSDLPSALREACGELAVLFKARHVRVHLSAALGDDILGPPGDRAGEPAFDVDLLVVEDIPLFRSAVGSSQPVVVQEAQSLDLPDPLAGQLADAAVHSLLVAPMMTRNEVIGMLTIGRDGRGREFSQADRLVGHTAADALVAVVENELLHRQETRQATAAERQRLARDLHDSVTQSIYSASLIAEALPAVWQRQPEEGLTNLVRLRRLVRAALAEMRTLLFELRPATLEAASLETLIERLADALTGQIQAPVEVSVTEDVPVPPEVKVALYRVVQEAFSNIAKHARPSRAAATLVAAAPGVALTVSDDGRGFDPHGVGPDHMGLRIMRERMDKIGASLLVESSPGLGTKVVVDWARPIPGRELAAQTEAN